MTAADLLRGILRVTVLVAQATDSH